MTKQEMRVILRNAIEESIRAMTESDLTEREKLENWFRHVNGRELKGNPDD